MGKLVVFHPSPYMVEKLDELIKKIAPDLEFENVVEPTLLDVAMETGITDDLRAKIREIIVGIPEVPGTVVLCSCSTIGGCAEEFNSTTRNTVIRIDRPMAEAAVATGSAIGLVAAVESTIGPTRELLESVAQDTECTVKIREILCASAWPHWEAGDSESYYKEVAACLERYAEGLDVIVLAQGSLAPVAQRVAHLGISVLSSPTLAVETVAQMCRHKGKR